MNALVAKFGSIPEISSAIHCLKATREKLLEQWPVTASNEWVSAPPPAVGEAFQLLHAGISHLENLCEYGDSSFDLVAKE